MGINNYIEHTLLKQDAKQADFEKLYKEAIDYKFFGVCVNPAYVKDAKAHLKNTGVKIVTVIGFPLGANTTDTKVFETKKALEDGADEIDMVISVQSLKDKDYAYTRKDIETVKAACGKIPLKVIIETDLLTKEEIKKACLIIAEAKADFAKTSTGFVKNGIGAKVEDVELMHETLKGTSVKIKAAGGIKDREKAEALIKAGASRLGTSSGVKLVQG